MMNTTPATTQNVQNVINSVANSVASETESSLGENDAFFLVYWLMIMSSKQDGLNANISKFSNIAFFDIGIRFFTFLYHIHTYTYIALA